MSDEADTKRVLDEWATALLAELELSDVPIDVNEILKLAGVAAHSIVRPAAPVTTWIVGYAAGLAAASGAGEPDGDAGGATASARAETLARRFGGSTA